MCQVERRASPPGHPRPRRARRSSLHWRTLLPWTNRRPLDAPQSAVRLALNRRRVESEKLSAPPQPLCPLFRNSGEPIVPNHSTHLTRRLVRKRILLKKRKNITIIRKQPYF